MAGRQKHRYFTLAIKRRARRLLILFLPSLIAEIGRLNTLPSGCDRSPSRAVTEIVHDPQRRKTSRRVRQGACRGRGVRIVRNSTAKDNESRCKRVNLSLKARAHIAVQRARNRGDLVNPGVCSECDSDIAVDGHPVAVHEMSSPMAQR